MSRNPTDTVSGIKKRPPIIQENLGIALAHPPLRFKILILLIIGNKNISTHVLIYAKTKPNSNEIAKKVRRRFGEVYDNGGICRFETF
jgi:hypothetical protein